MLRITVVLALVALACQAAPLSDDKAVEELYNSVVINDISSAVAETKELEKAGRGALITKAVDKLLEEGQKNFIDYAYQLYDREGQSIIKAYFPLTFRLVFGSHTVKLVSKGDGLAIKLGKDIDSDGDRTAYGDSSDLTGGRVAWKFSPYYIGSSVYFKIYNPMYNQFLKTGKSVDSDGDHAVYGSSDSDNTRHLWRIVPMTSDGDVIFYIFNAAFNAPLKLGRSVDSDGDRQLYGALEPQPYGNPKLYGWVISPH